MGKLSDKLFTELTEIKATQNHHSEKLVEYNTLLTEHMKRTELMEDRFKPVEDHVKFVRHLLKALTYLMALGGSVASVWQLFH